MRLIFAVSDDLKKRFKELIERRDKLVGGFESRQEQLKRIFNLPDLIAALSLLETLRPDMPEGVPQRPYFEDCFNRASDMVGTLEAMYAFDTSNYPTGFEADARRLNTELQARTNELRAVLPALMGFYASYQNEVGLGPRVSEADQSLESIKSSRQRIDELVAATKTTTAQTAMDAHVNVFEEESEKYKSESRNWLIVVGITSLVGVIAIWLYVQFYPPTKGDDISLISFIGIKVLLIALFFTLLTLAIRRHTASSHNLIINRHRASAIKTFELFVGSARNDETRDAILKCAAESIFSMQRSGLLGKDQPAPNPISVNALSMPGKSS